MAAVNAMTTVCLDSRKRSTVGDIMPFSKQMASRTDPVLLAVLNPHDKRKRIDALIKGALQSLAEGYRFTLVIKLVINGASTHIANINEILHRHFKCYETSDRIVFCAGRLEDPDMAALRAMSDFHISASSAEGLNLPLVESALQDIPIITTHNTAMASYLDPDDAIWIACDAAPTPDGINAFSDDADFTHFPPSSDGIAKAIGTALELSPEARGALAARGRQAVERRFGQARFETDFRAIARQVQA